MEISKVPRRGFFVFRTYMLHILAGLIAIFIFCGITGCDNDSKYSMVELAGRWKVTISDPGRSPVTHGWKLERNGEVIEVTRDYTGTWSLNNKDFALQYREDVIVFRGEVQDINTISGSWTVPGRTNTWIAKRI